MKAKNMKEWHRFVCAGGKCEICGIWYSPNMLCGHHKKTKGAHPELKLETDNGICVCALCHYRIHTGEIKI